MAYILPVSRPRAGYTFGHSFNYPIKCQISQPGKIMNYKLGLWKEHQNPIYTIHSIPPRELNEKQEFTLHYQVYGALGMWLFMFGSWNREDVIFYLSHSSAFSHVRRQNHASDEVNLALQIEGKGYCILKVFLCLSRLLWSIVHTDPLRVVEKR